MIRVIRTRRFEAFDPFFLVLKPAMIAMGSQIIPITMPNGMIQGVREKKLVEM
jgi:hypothetical protein